MIQQQQLGPSHLTVQGCDCQLGHKIYTHRCHSVQRMGSSRKMRAFLGRRKMQLFLLYHFKTSWSHTAATPGNFRANQSNWHAAGSDGRGLHTQEEPFLSETSPSEFVKLLQAFLERQYSLNKKVTPSHLAPIASQSGTEQCTRAFLRLYLAV